jgi:hypothetical protein
MDAKIAASHWSDPELQPLSAEMLLTLHWMKTNQDRNDCGAYRFNAALFTFQTKLPADWHEKTRAALPERFAQDGVWFLYVPFISECLQLGTMSKNGGLNNMWKALAKPFQALTKPLQRALVEKYPELGSVVPEYVINQCLGKTSVADTLQALTKPLPRASASPEGQEQSRAEQSRAETGECEGGTGALVPAEEEVLAYATGFEDMARGLKGISEDYALRWLAWRSEPKAGPFPRDWKADLRRRFVADAIAGTIKKTAGPGPGKPSGRLEQLREALLHEPDKEKCDALRRQIRALENPTPCTRP